MQESPGVVLVYHLWISCRDARATSCGNGQCTRPRTHATLSSQHTHSHHHTRTSLTRIIANQARHKRLGKHTVNCENTLKLEQYRKAVMSPWHSLSMNITHETLQWILIIYFVFYDVTERVALPISKQLVRCKLLHKSYELWRSINAALMSRIFYTTSLV